MPLPLLPVIVASFGAAAWYKSTKTKPTAEKGVLTPARQVIFDQAMNETREPEKLRKLALMFREQGLSGQADALDKCAKLREMPAHVKEARREAFRKAMSSQDAKKVRWFALIMEKEGALGAAASLREYAASIKPPAPTVEVAEVVQAATPEPETHIPDAQPSAEHTEPTEEPAPTPVH